MPLREPYSRLGVVGQDAPHRVGGTTRRRVVVMGVALERERGRGVSGESLQVPYGLAALGEQGQATMPEVVEPDGGRPARTPVARRRSGRRLRVARKGSGTRFHAMDGP